MSQQILISARLTQESLVSLKRLPHEEHKPLFVFVFVFIKSEHEGNPKPNMRRYGLTPQLQYM